MPELRKDPVVGRWVIIARERARRPGNFVDTSGNEVALDRAGCTFCNNYRQVIPMEKSSDKVAVVFADGGCTDSKITFQRTKHGLYDVIDKIGAHEIVIETPEHVANMADLEMEHIQLVFEAYAQRLKALEKVEQYRYALVYKNYGSTAGGRNVGHTRSHIVATPVRPLRVKEKLIGAQKYYDENGHCVYCDLIEQEKKSGERIIHETRHFIALIPFAARFLFEICILPKDHHCDFHIGIERKEEDLALMMKVVLQKIQQGLDDPAYNFAIQTAPFRRKSKKEKKWKTIEEDYHWHIELTPRLTRIAGFEKGTGFYICAVPPEDMAEFLRGIKL
jgi:UDPglucose--hexose-1-phosphate uridylyltransferase